MSHITIITNPWVLKDPFIDKRQWSLCIKGIERAKKISALNIWTNAKKIYSGPEISDCQTSIIISGLCKIPFFIKENLKDISFERKYLHNDHLYKRALNTFFRFPHLHFENTEKCEDVQRRIIGCITEIMTENKNKDIVIIFSETNLILLKSYISNKPPEYKDLENQNLVTIIDWENKNILEEINQETSCRNTKTRFQSIIY